jgi:proteasome accessory factor B
MKKSQMIRIVAFDSLVREGKNPNCINFSVDYEVSSRTVMRDVDYLRCQLGAPLEYDQAKRGFYYSEDWDLPAVIKMCARNEDRITGIIQQLKELSESELELVIKAAGKDMARTPIAREHTVPILAVA